MMRVLAFAMAIFVASNMSAQCDQLFWADEFDGSQLNTSNWTPEIGNGCPSLCGWGNNEWQYYTDSPDNIIIEDGLLKIRAVHSPGADLEYTSARLITKENISFASGRVEARMKMPIGQGMWPAFWMLPEDTEYGGWPLSGEIDIMEMVGFEPNTTHGTIHYGGRWPFNIFTGEGAALPNGTLNDDFHTYAVEWGDGEIRWYFDDALFSVKTINDLGDFPWPFDRKYHIILNLAVGGNWPGYPDASTIFPQELQVDYVRVYQGPTTAFIEGDETLTEPGTVEYSVPNIAGANFDWSATGGTVISGQGTSNVAVEWVEAETNNISCAISYADCNYTLDKDVDVKTECSVILSDFEDQRLLKWAWFEGVYEESAPPSPNEINSSANCARYMRSTDAASALRMTLRGLNTTASIENGESFLTMKLFTNAPVGSTLFAYLEDQESTNFPGSNGRRLTFSHVTTTQLEWVDVVFNQVGSVNENVSPEEINFFTFVPIVSENVNYSFFMDDIAVTSADCLPSVSVQDLEELDVNLALEEGQLSIYHDLPLEVEIYTLVGSLVERTRTNAGAHSIELNAGAYLVILRNDQGQRLNQKIIIR